MDMGSFQGLDKFPVIAVTETAAREPPEQDSIANKKAARRPPWYKRPTG
jgi:hypothetical protein